MKIRTQRVHHMGASNRNQDFNNLASKSVFEASYIKSQSLYNKNQKSFIETAPIREQKTAKPFKGTNMQMTSVRWNSQSKKIGSQTKWNLHAPVAPLDYSSNLNQEVSDIVSQFKEKQVNSYKLNSLKHTFVKNNKNKRNLRNYFNMYANQKQKIGIPQLQAIVKQYGYDITNDQAKLMFKLSGGDKQLNLQQFVQLMSKQNIYFSTLKLKAEGNNIISNFKQNIHVVFKNKFNQLQQAFNIYKMRGQSIDYQKYNYVLKKLDITDLVISKQERNQIFLKFSNQGQFNSERLFGAIIEQDRSYKAPYPPKLSYFQDNIKVNQQIKAKIQNKTVNYDFKKMSNLQYQHQLKYAKQVVEVLKKFTRDGKDIFEGNIQKQQFKKRTQKYLQQKGINFNKQQYDCYAAFFQYDKANKIDLQTFNKILKQDKSNTMERFQRRLRSIPPRNTQNNTVINEFDQKTAIQSLQKIKAKKLQTQTRKIFKSFDNDKDGFLSRQQFKNCLKQASVIQNWQIQNLINYFDPSGKGYVQYPDFSKKFDPKPNNNINADAQPLSKLKSQSDWINSKKTFIKQSNSHYWQVPTKYSAWPQKLKYSDLSLVQPPSKAGQYQSQSDRFNSKEKHEVGQNYKQQKIRLYENKLRKLAAWNQQNNESVIALQQKTIKRETAKDYSLRITKQIYQQRCHDN